MKNNIIYLYILYVMIVYLLLIMDITVLMYYIFWVNNVFISPLFWLLIKIMYYNRTVLLLLLFYYFIAKYTIKELGYKYFYFFNIDIRKWRLIYLNYFWSITTYHIEIISIFIFFLIIVMPLLVYNKNIFFLICNIFIFFLIWLRILKNRFKYIIKKRVRIRSFFFFLLSILLFMKIFNYQYIKDLYTLYIYLDEWVFELLEWKIKMYNKVIERDIYDQMIGLKPVWIGEKLSKKETVDNKWWDYLCKKNKNNLIKELKYKLKRTKRKYYLFIKYYERVLFVKNDQVFNKISILKKNLLFKKFINYKSYYDKIKIKESYPRIDTTKENPVITQEKEKERNLHRTVLTNIIYKFSMKNYYRLNLLLRDLTLNKLYYQPFIDKKGIQKQIVDEKRNFFSICIKDRLHAKDDLFLLKNIIVKVKKNIQFLNIMKSNMGITNYDINNKFVFEKLFNYLIIEKKIKNMSNYLFKKFKIKDINFNKKKGKLVVKQIFKNIIEDIKIKEKINKLYFFYESKQNIIKKDKLETIKRNTFCSYAKYIEKNELEKMDNKALYNTVKKYNEEKTKIGWKNEFSDFFILKEKKENLSISDSPDLSRRNKK